VRQLGIAQKEFLAKIGVEILPVQEKGMVEEFMFVGRGGVFFFWRGLL
jgi:hypothetical protein